MNPDPWDYGWWLASRSAGIIAILAVSASVLIGLMMANGLPRKAGAKKQLLAVHESTALIGLAAIAIHGLTLIGDAYLHPALSQILIPFTISYRPLFTGLGIIAGWGAAILGLSFYARRHIGARRWRSLHRWTMLVWALAVIHVIGAGTDSGQIWMQAIIALTTVPILALFVRRILIPSKPAARKQTQAASNQGRVGA